ncbi:MAG: RNA polymerase sigma factor [Elusimicrobiota bacterium]|nr:RNA polymerase sigma factor [Elusimicrobiota bacterium]
MEEKRFIEKLKEGDEDAYREFMSKHKDSVYRIIYSFSGMASEIDDIAQEVFITVFRKIHKFRGNSSLSTWLYRVTINKCKDYLRKRRTDIVELTDTIVSPVADVSETLLNAVRAKALLSSLPEKLRSVVVLRETEALSYDEIAKTLKIPIGRVKIMLFRARKKMKEAVLNGM